MNCIATCLQDLHIVVCECEVAVSPFCRSAYSFPQVVFNVQSQLFNHHTWLQDKGQSGMDRLNTMGPQYDHLLEWLIYELVQKRQIPVHLQQFPLHS